MNIDKDDDWSMDPQYIVYELEDQLEELKEEVVHLRKISPLLNPFHEYLDKDTDEVEEFLENKGDEIQDFITNLIKEYKENENEYGKIELT